MNSQKGPSSRSPLSSNSLRKTPPSVSLIVTIAIALSGAAISPTMNGWESDVHYVLTSWLAYQTGFSQEDADRIAQADQSYDDSHYHAAIPTMLMVLILGDTGAARDLQRKHFPSEASLPSPPDRRVVVANGKPARELVEQAIAPKAVDVNLAKFGEALHPFQDSWSHQGVPDVPFGLQAKLSCAHPADRGGWMSHDADLTYLHVDDTLEVAKTTYDVMLKFLKRHRRFAARKPTPWSKLEPLVREFAQAASKAAKSEWSVKQLNKREASAFEGLTLAGPRAVGIRSETILPPGTRGERGAPLKLVNSAKKFVDNWFVEQRIGNASEFVDWQEIRLQFVDTPTAANRESVIEWCQKFLTMYLIEDHSAVNAAGHCNPRAEGYARLPREAVREGAFRTSRVHPPIVESDAFMEIERDRKFAMTFQVEGLPYDAVCLVWTLNNQTWSITQMLALVA